MHVVRGGSCLGGVGEPIAGKERRGDLGGDEGSKDLVSDEDWGERGEV